MPGLPNINFDRLSFLLGILAATGFWWIIQNLRRTWPRMREQLNVRKIKQEKKEISLLELQLRREVVRRAQSMHLTCSLFSLDEILIQPRLLAPLPRIVPGGQLPPDEILSYAQSYLPDWPELAARFNTPVIGLAECLQNGSNIAVIGQPGAGKTVCLAQLAGQVAQGKPEVGILRGYFPIFLHISDLPLDIPKGGNLLAPISGYLSSLASGGLSSQVPAFLQTVFSSGNALLIIDGMDEYPPAYIEKTKKYLHGLLDQYPQTRLVVAASSDYVDGLTSLNLAPLSIAAWTEKDYGDYIHRWQRLWTEKIVPEFGGSITVDPVDPTLLNAWLLTESFSLSPLEFSLKVWSAYLGDPRGAYPKDAVAAFINRSLGDDQAYPIIQGLALQMIYAQHPVLDRNKLIQKAEALVPAQPTSRTSSEASAKSGETSTGHKTIEGEKSGTAQRLISTWIQSGLLVNRVADQIQFSHSVITGFLAGQGLAGGDHYQGLSSQSSWTGKAVTIHYLTACEDNPTLIHAITVEGEEPLYSGLFQAARWIKDIPPHFSCRASLLKNLADVVQRENLPMGSRQRALAGLLLSADSGIPLLFRSWLESKSPALRQLAALGCGAVRDIKSLDSLAASLYDPVPLVRYAACLAAASIPGRPALESLVQALESGDEDLRRAAAEALARRPDDGFEILKHGSRTEDILVRRAVVFGLIQVHQPWAVEILEKMRVEDGQWVVRSAATQAVEAIQLPNAHLPEPMPHPSEAPWVISYASQQGVGVSAGMFPIDLLIKALKSGTEEERIASLDYLRQIHDDSVLGSLLQTIYCDVEQVSEAALYALWYLMVSGVKLPSPKNYGLA